MTCICLMTCRHSLCIRSCSAPRRKSCSQCVTVNRFPLGYRNFGRPADSTGSICRLCRPTTPPTLLSATLAGSVDPHAASRLWELTRGNVLYLRHIVEQEVADGRLENQHGYWQWIGDPIMPCGLVELIESRIGALPTAVGAVDRRACDRRADRAGSAQTNHRSRRRRGSRHPWPDQPRPHRHRCRSPCGTPALRRGTQETRRAHPAAAAARTRRHRTGCRRQSRRHPSRDPTRHLEPRLRPHARC